MVTKTYLKPTYPHTYPCDSSESSDSSDSSENIVVVVPVVARQKKYSNKTVWTKTGE